MALFIDDIIDIHTLNAITEVLDDKQLFENGKRTASGSAKSVKNNMQALNSGSVSGALKLLEKALLENSALRNAAIPETFVKIMFNRYDSGMSYGAHVDEAFIAGARTDLSFTLFLSDPNSYEGGELVIKRDDGDEQVKLPKGSLYLYPSNTIHYVAPVTSGSRLSAVGWIQSKVRLQEQRQVLFDLSTALNALPSGSTAEHDTRLTLQNVRNNLLRMWAD